MLANAQLLATPCSFQRPRSIFPALKRGAVHSNFRSESRKSMSSKYVFRFGQGLRVFGGKERNVHMERHIVARAQ
jgi:hypothetical protein